MTTPHRFSLRSLVLGAAVLVAACGGHAANGDDVLKHDLDAASGNGLALAPRGSQTQVVSALELGAAGAKANPTAAPAPARTGTPAAVPQHVAARAPAPRIIERVRYVDRVVDREPTPAAEVAPAVRAPEPAPVASVPEPAPPAASPVPAPRRYPEPVDGRSRPSHQRRPWDMGDVIRNAPFPINP